MEEFYFTGVQNSFSIFYAPKCGSTGNVAREILKTSKNRIPFLVYTFEQTQGRGQGNNHWESEPGANLAVTFVFNERNSDNLILLNKAITLGVAAVLAEISGAEVKIKWPNDVLINNEKCSGLLFETFKTPVGQYLFAGIGINVNQKKWTGNFKASSLSKLSGKSYELSLVLHQLIEYIYLYYNNINKVNISEEFNRWLWKLNKRVWIEHSNNTREQVTLLEVDESGRLVFLDKDNQINRLHHGVIRIHKSQKNIF